MFLPNYPSVKTRGSALSGILLQERIWQNSGEEIAEYPNQLTRNRLFTKYLILCMNYADITEIAS